MSKVLNIAPNRRAMHPFDLKYGTDTGGYLSPHQLRTGRAGDATNNGYSAVAPSVFREACRRWRETLPFSAARVGPYTFVDVGAGKGRALLLAAELTFRRVIGVELNEDLARIAQRNVALWSRIAKPLARIRVLRQDASEFRWPRSPLLVYLNNPFEFQLVEQLAARLTFAAESGPGLVDILYVNPAYPETLIRTGKFKLLWNEQFEMDRADQQADPYGATSDRMAALRFYAQDNATRPRDGIRS